MRKKNDRIRILVAMEREAEALGIPCEIIGIGAKDLPETAENDILVNVGYCGGYRIPVGTVIEPRFVCDSRTAEVKDLVLHFPCENRLCVTSDTFVTEPLYEAPAIYDMELWKISGLPCKKLYCLKIVSDNLDEKACEVFDDAGAWDRVKKMLEGENLI